MEHDTAKSKLLMSDGGIGTYGKSPLKRDDSKNAQVTSIAATTP